MGLTLPKQTHNQANGLLLKYSLALFISLSFAITGYAQNSGSVGIGTKEPSSNSILDIKSDKGLLIPRLTGAEAQSLKDKLLTASSPDEVGMLIFNKDESKLKYWDGTDWVDIASGSGSNGKGIEAAAVNANGELEILLTDGSVINAGVVAGINGKGVQNAAVNANGELEILLEDGSIVNAGVVAGLQGAKGEAGTAWHTGSGVPANVLAKSGDLYLDQTFGDVYKLGDSGNWSVVTNLKNGAPGVGIQVAKINASGKLYFKYSNGTTDTVGVVVGANGKDGVDGKDGLNGIDGKDGINGTNGLDGAPGAPGAPGKDGIDGKDGTGILAATVNQTTGHLEITYSDSPTVKDAGLVKGADGKGIASVAVLPSGQLELTLSDGTKTTTASSIKGADGKTVTGAVILGTGQLELTLNDGSKVTTATSVKGADGTTITAAAILGTGQLELTQSDGTKVTTATSVRGTDGKSIAAAAVLPSGQLELTMSDNTTVTTPTSVKGSDAKAVTAGALLNTGQIELTFSDNSKMTTTNGAWRLGGNSGTAGNISQFIGTSDSKPLLFGTENTEKMRILSNGRLGIGTPTPLALLHVNGDFKLGNNGTVLKSIIHETVAVDIPEIPGNTSHVHSFSVSNALEDAAVSVSPESTLPDGVIISYARVTSSGTIEVKFYNAKPTPQNPDSMNYSFGVINK